MKVALGADSAGKPLLDVIAAHLARQQNVEVTDLSREGFYADTAADVAHAILDGRHERGVLFCGTGLDPRHLFGGAGGEIEQCPDHHDGRARHRSGAGQGDCRFLARLGI